MGFKSFYPQLLISNNVRPKREVFWDIPRNQPIFAKLLVVLWYFYLEGMIRFSILNESWDEDSRMFLLRKIIWHDVKDEVNKSEVKGTCSHIAVFLSSQRCISAVLLEGSFSGRISSNNVNVWCGKRSNSSRRPFVENYTAICRNHMAKNCRNLHVKLDLKLHVKLHIKHVKNCRKLHGKKFRR